MESRSLNLNEGNGDTRGMNKMIGKFKSEVRTTIMGGWTRMMGYLSGQGSGRPRMLLGVALMVALSLVLGVFGTADATLLDGRVLYSNNTTTPQVRSYTASSNSFGTAGATVAGAAQTFMVQRNAPTRKEAIAGYVTTGGVLYILRWDGSAWTNEWNVTVGGNGVDGRRFDIAYEKTSGNAMVVYSTNAQGSAGNEMAYRIWNGTSWTAATNINSARFTQAAAVTSIKMKSRPTAGSNEIALTACDSGTTTANTAVLSSFIWNGSTWTEPAAAHTTATTTYLPNTTGQLVQNDLFDLAYETLSGDLIVVFTTGGTAQQWYITKTAAGTWGTATSLATGYAAPLQMVAESNPEGDQVLVLFNRSANATVYGAIWSGTAMGTATSIGTNGVTTAIEKKHIAAKWLSLGGADYAVAVWSTSTNGTLGYNAYNTSTSAWGTAATYVTGTGAAVNWMDSDWDHVGTDNMLLTFSTGAAGSGSLWAKRLVVTAGPTFTWSNADGGTALSTALASATTQNFSFAYNEYLAVITSCDGCHGYPPVDGTRNAATRAVVGSHGKHVIGQGMACTACHVDNGTAPTGLGHREGLIEMVSGATALSGGYYDKNNDGVYNAGVDNTFAMSASPTLGTCRTTVCHSANSPVWGTAGPLACDSCHALPPTSGAHTAHYTAKGWATGSTANCTVCHPDNTTTHSAVNGTTIVQVAGATIGGTSPAITCASISATGCHNNIATASPAWNVTPGTITCTNCHTVGGTNSATVANPVSGLHNMTAAGVQKHDNTLSTGCTVCHVKASITGHFNGTASATADYTAAQVGVSTLSGNGAYTDAGGTGTSRGTCTASCHTDGNRWARQWSTAANSTVTTMNDARCAVCHGDWTNTWRTGTIHATAGTKGGPGSQHNGDCSLCHAYGHANYTAANSHENNVITMNSNGTSYARGTGANAGWAGCSACHNGAVANDAHAFTTSSFTNTPTVAGNAIPGGTCTSCHANPQGTRRAVMADFTKPSHHVSNGTTTSIVTAFDCIVCHAEGSTASSGTNITTTTAHMDSNVSLRNVDNVANPGTAGTNFWQWPATGRTSTHRDQMDSFCMGCHDSNGASGINVATGNTSLNLSATRALTPFNTNDNLRGNTYDVTALGTYRTTTYGRVLNVKDQFNSTNATTSNWASHHNLNQFSKRYTTRNTSYFPSAIFTAYTTKDGVALNGTTAGTGETAGLHCSDCHLNELNAHGTTARYFLASGTTDSDVAWNGASGQATNPCYRCHNSTAYSSSGSLGRFQHNRDSSRTLATMTSPLGIICFNCHGQYIGTLPTSAVAPAGLGAIHGNNDTYYPGYSSTTGTSSKRYRFMGGAQFRNYKPTTATYTGTGQWTAAGGGTCYTTGTVDTWQSTSCSSHNSGTNMGSYFNYSKPLSW